jgi:hypothetical protein
VNGTIHLHLFALYVYRLYCEATLDAGVLHYTAVGRLETAAKATTRKPE